MKKMHIALIISTKTSKSLHVHFIMKLIIVMVLFTQEPAKLISADVPIYDIIYNFIETTIILFPYELKTYRFNCYSILFSTP